MLRKIGILPSIIIAVLIEAILIGAICLFSYYSYKKVSSKLRFIEIFDDLNISLLEMRKEEKNYFLYKNPDALVIIREKGKELRTTIESLEPDIVPVTNQNTYNLILSCLNSYIEKTETLTREKSISFEIRRDLRSLGQQLTRQFAMLVKRERHQSNVIIHNNTRMLFLSLGLIFIFQLVVWLAFFQTLIHRLQKMKRLIRVVSEGRFHKVAEESIKSKDEISLAIKAIVKMAKKLEKREEQLLEAKKLASLGILISGVAHELGNPLNNISMIAQTYLEVFDDLDKKEKKDFIIEILSQTERIKKIVYNLLDFSRQKEPEFEKCEIKTVVERSVQLVRNQLEISDIRLHVSISNDLPYVYVDVDQIRRVLINLFTNAIQAMSQGGDLFVEVNKEDNMAVIKVRDTGVGIKPDVLPHVFDPFFTTKGTKGTGLGLSLSYGIIKKHNGTISVESEVGIGTTFTIKLPLYDEKGGKLCQSELS